MRKLKNSELGRLSIPEFKQAGKLPVTVILDNVRSLYNIGSVFRSSDAFLIERICLCGITACPPHRDIRKTALGATESVDWTYYRETTAAVDELKTSGYRIIAVEQTDAGIPMNEFKASRTEKYAIIFGHEIRGVEQEIVDMADQCIEIPQFGTKHSLNISVSAGIVLWHFHNSLHRHRS